MPTMFFKLNQGWNADPYSPSPQVTVDGDVVRLEFKISHIRFPRFAEGTVGRLTFSGCSRYRLGPTNSDGWLMGNCRFSKLAPAWGEFYQVGGDLLLEKCLDEWKDVNPDLTPAKHFLFYLRDETFECDADGWTFTSDPPAAAPAGMA